MNESIVDITLTPDNFYNFSKETPIKRSLKNIQNKLQALNQTDLNIDEIDQEEINFYLQGSTKNIEVYAK